MGKINDDVFVLGADITSSVGADAFAENFPERFLSLGIAEQNIMGVAAGMALEGKVPFMVTYGVFSALRTTDQIRISVCYNKANVKIGGAHAGISVGPDGATHQALEDMAVLRALPNMTILSPCDATQTRLATLAAVNQVQGPCYIRFGKAPMPDFTSEDQHFEVGKAQVLSEGNDLAIIATGHMVWEAIRAAARLEENNIKARVLNMHTIKPIDGDAICACAQECGAILCAEEHQITGGLGSAVAEVVVKSHPVPMEFVGMPDCFGESGQPVELLEKYGMNADEIFRKAISLMKRKANQHI